jgi:hypothetical protein
MPTGSYVGVVGDGDGLGWSADEGGEHDIWGKQPCDGLQVADLYSGITKGSPHDVDPQCGDRKSVATMEEPLKKNSKTDGVSNQGVEAT